MLSSEGNPFSGLFDPILQHLAEGRDGEPAYRADVVLVLRYPLLSPEALESGFARLLTSPSDRALIDSTLDMDYYRRDYEKKTRDVRTLAFVQPHRRRKPDWFRKLAEEFGMSVNHVQRVASGAGFHVGGPADGVFMPDLRRLEDYLAVVEQGGDVSSKALSGGT